MYASRQVVITTMDGPGMHFVEDIAMRRTIIALAVLALLPVASASAQRVVRREARDVRMAQRELREDKADRRQDARDGDRGEVRRDTREIRRDQRVLHREKRDLKHAVARRRHGR